MRRALAVVLAGGLLSLVLGGLPAAASGTADVSIALSASPSPVTADSDLTYRLTVSNAGPDPADHVVFYDVIPPDVIFRSATSPGTYSPQTGRVTWAIGTLAAGGTSTQNVVITPIHPAPGGITDSAVATTGARDPTTPNTASARTIVADEAGVQYVSVRDSGISPFFRSVPLGGTLQWDFFGPSVHQITDAHGLGLIDSGPRSPVSYYRYTFDLSAEIRTADVGFPNNGGKVVVPIDVAPSSGSVSTQFGVTWALDTLPAGIVEDVQIKRPGDVRWSPFRHATSTLGTSFTPDAGTGTYAFRDRIRSTVNGAHSRFGPPVPISVS